MKLDPLTVIPYLLFFDVSMGLFQVYFFVTYTKRIDKILKLVTKDEV